MPRGLRVHTRKSIRKPIRTDMSAEERNESARKSLGKWAAKCREEGPLLFRGWKGDWILDRPIETKKPTSSK